MDVEADDFEFDRTCPNTLRLFPESFRKPLQNMVDGMCPKRSQKRRLTALEFSPGNLNHLKIIKDMGINIVALNDGRVQLLHTFSAVSSTFFNGRILLIFQVNMHTGLNIQNIIYCVEISMANYYSSLVKKKTSSLQAFLMVYYSPD